MDTFDRFERTYPVIDDWTDSREQLARAKMQANKRNFDDVFIVDIDSHIGEDKSWPEVLTYLEDPVMREAASAFGDGTGRGAFLNNTPGLQWQNVWGRIPHGQGLKEKLPDDGVSRSVTLSRRCMDQMGLDYQVMFPNGLLFLGMHPVPEMEIHLSLAYNRWLVERVLPEDDRVQAMLYLPFNDPVEAEKTVKRFLGKKGVAGFLVTSSRHKPVHANEYMRLYSMLEESGQVLGFHAHLNWQDEYTKQLNRFISMHAISFVLCNLVHLTNWVINGMNERFPKLNVLWIESGLAWLPFIMQRLDHEYLMRTSEAPLLKKLPSEYMRDMYYTSQPMEHTSDKLLDATMDAIKADTQLLYASDWPHWDFDLPARIWDLPFLDEQAKRNILGLNAARIFNLPIPDKYTKKAAAAE